jgi:subtilisin family serine protease
MHLRSWFLSLFTAKILALRPWSLGTLLLLTTLFLAGLPSTQPSYANNRTRNSATGPESNTTSNAANNSVHDTENNIENNTPTTPRRFASYIILLDQEPVAAFYASLLEDGVQDNLQDKEQAQSAAIHALTQAQLATVEAAQLQIVATLAHYDAQVIYRVQRVLNGIAVYAPADQVPAIAALPGVEAVYPLVPKEPTNARVDELLNAPALWQGITGAGLTGQGVSIALIDTGIDYLHTMFGGPGTGYARNDTNVIGDVPNFPGAKVVGGYDFAGDNYDAIPTSSNYQPIPEPDPDPMDCYSFGHGTHVAGTAAGYGVRADGKTYRGPYDLSIALDSLRIGPGVAPQAQLYALKVFGCAGSSDVVESAIEWAVDPNQDGDFSDHVDIINMSLGSSFGASFDATTIAVENAAKLGIIVVTSAGNTGDVHYAVGSPGVATHAIAVAATNINSTVPGHFEDGTVATFSARGPRRGDDAIKPDLAAPGVNIFSASRATGDEGITSSGTSMASPVVAGTMALLRQAHPLAGSPGWRSQELKALAMNTAFYPLLGADGASPYGLSRVGAGRIDPTHALQSHLIAYDAAAPDRVSVSFGTVDVLDHTSVVRSIRLANKSAAPISVTVSYTTVSNLPGVTLDVGAGKVITVPAFGIVTTPVTLTANATQMARHPDPTRQVPPPDSRPWVDEASGYISFTPVITTTGPSIHLPILALPRIVSALDVLSAPLDLASTLTATFPLTITGSSIYAAVAPTQTVPLIGVFGLAHSSPPIFEAPNGVPNLGHYAEADLRYVGTAGPILVNGEAMLYFALVSYGPWSTPLEMTYQIAIDVNDDNIADFQLQNRESTDLSVFDIGSSDDFVSLLAPIGAIRVVQGPLNIYPSTQYDTRPFGNNVMVLPLRLSDLGDNVHTLHYQITSTSRDLMDVQASELIEQTPRLSLSLDSGAGVVTEMGVPLFPAPESSVITVTFDHAAYIQQYTQGLLLLYLHNDLSTRSQVLPVEYDWLNNQYLPRINTHP